MTQSMKIIDGKDIFLAGGCFWGTEHYFKQIEGVVETEVGFANGHTANPSYKEVYTDTTGYTDTEDLPVIEKVFAEEQKNYNQPLAVEKMPLQNFYTAEEYHQDYLDKNPDGYCHLPLSLFDQLLRREILRRNTDGQRHHY